MKTSGKSLNKNMGRKQGVLLFLLLTSLLLIVFPALILPLFLDQSSLQLKVGEVAPREFVAPRTLTFVSEILTERQRENAARAVSDIYTPPDTSIARRQLERLRAALAYITSVRSDTFASPEQKLSDLSAMEDIHLNQEIAKRILSLSDSRWQAIQQESIIVLEQVMRATIRQDQLEEVRRSVPTLVSLSFPEEQAAIVSELVKGFVAPNSVFSPELTEAARQQARGAVQPVERSFVQGETIVPRGKVLTETDIEALEQFGLIKPFIRWQDLASPALLTVFLAAYLLIYLVRTPALVTNSRGLIGIFVLFASFLVISRLFAGNESLVLYFFPIAAFSMAISSLFGIKTAMVFAMPLCVLFAYNTANALELLTINLLASYFSIFALGAARRITAFFWAAAVIILIEIGIAFVFRLPQPNFTLLSALSISGAALVNGIASSTLAVLLQYSLAQFLGLTTALQLMEISRPDHPLLQFILRNAPGTYQHSLQVANLAEQAAERIGADPLLTRVGALYHDAGKALNPYYYIENQLPGNPNPHDELDPVTSAKIIIQHVHDGVRLAQKYRLPRRVQDFILEHHGTMIARYQYARAIEASGDDGNLVDENLFRYPGPRPRSRETAILMLADGAEARVRAERPKDDQELHKLIKSVIEQRLSSGQLDETDLTLRELDQISDLFTTTLRGLFHPRLEYPTADKTIPRRETSPTIPAVTRNPGDVQTDLRPDT